MKAKKIIAIYLRLSSEDKDEDKDESNSITNQRFLLHSFMVRVIQKESVRRSALNCGLQFC